MPALTTQERDRHLPELEAAGWTVAEDGASIAKTYKFKTFPMAFGFMTRAALYAEKWDHHPDWSNTYNTVAVQLSTHDIGGLSDLDVKLAKKMDELA
ncbi:pterin dehydratase [Pseudooceanicola batsensis HTCC2597]|uniref:Putative pterin-4-alpha-carbinolamine dehydratase n=1 Tax=Pseudooceanicola batsensis (strain ATCC BAA-863 / DSM 15984 / KCTC 12145 / HTCC2597) TaxID=252305 RepID=A3TVR9_PSEBH|nr:4a-hydroxytetrahydrobiopterin dehydratase [Pseudooceanicola batsensis]EAQ03715.1 pterin dehydratase [Pseudooceanicola batsensis HTCC2597]